MFKEKSLVTVFVVLCNIERKSSDIYVRSWSDGSKIWEFA